MAKISVQSARCMDADATGLFCAFVVCEQVKKFIPLILFVVFSCSGIAAKNQLFNYRNPNILSEENLNHCLQNILWLPIGLVGAGYLLFFPNEFTDWFNQIANIGAEDKSPVIKELLGVRLIGGLFFVITIVFSLLNRIYWNYCTTAIKLLSH